MVQSFRDLLVWQKGMVKIALGSEQSSRRNWSWQSV